MSKGISPLTTVQTAETESPQFTALSAISNGAIRGGTMDLGKYNRHNQSIKII